MPSLKGEYPPEIAHLVRLFGGSPNAAERAIGVSLGEFSRIAAGRKKFTDAMRGRVTAAIQEREHGMTSEPQAKKDAIAIPETCPPLLADLIRAKGNKSRARQFLGASGGPFYGVVGGRQQMPPGWIVRIKAELGQPVIGHDSDMGQPSDPGPQAPPFVPWDGKKVSLTVKSQGGKTRVIKNVPAPVAALVERYGGSVGSAAAAMGMTGGSLIPIVEGTAVFNEKRQRKVHDALHGIAPAEKHSMGADYDKYELGMAIVMLNGSAFDRIHDIADILKGHLIFKKNTKAGWLLIYRMATKDLPMFKKLALRDANEIVCP